MPFKSEAQRRFMFAAQARGELPKGTAEKWAKETKAKKLPEYAAQDEKQLRRLKRAKRKSKG